MKLGPCTRTVAIRKGSNLLAGSDDLRRVDRCREIRDPDGRRPIVHRPIGVIAPPWPPHAYKPTR